MSIRLICCYRGEETVKCFEQMPVVIGRAGAEPPADLDLYPDTNVSRRHARIWCEDNRWWAEDLGSKFGTRLNGSEIKGQGRQPLVDGATLRMGDTLVRVELPADEVLPLGLTETPTEVSIGTTLDAESSAFILSHTASEELKQRQMLLLELPLSSGRRRVWTPYWNWWSNGWLRRSLVPNAARCCSWTRKATA